MQEALHAAHLAQAEGAVLGLLREGAADHDKHDAVLIAANVTADGSVTIDVTYYVRGVPVSGESL